MSQFSEMGKDVRVLTVKFCGSERSQEFNLSAKEYSEFKSEWQKFKGLMSWVTFHPVDFKDQVSINTSLIAMILWDDRPDDPNDAQLKKYHEFAHWADLVGTDIYNGDED